MASAASTVSRSRISIEWMWQSNVHAWSSSEPPAWSHYSDLENMIIEEAFSTHQPRALLDEYYIDLVSNMQISNTDPRKQRPVKRVTRQREHKHLREARFMDLPVASDRSFGGKYGFVSPFIIAVRTHLHLTPEQLPSKRPELIPLLVERAAQGFIIEGKHLGKQREAEKLASLLLEKQHSSMKEVWQCCAYLYSLESFLYQTMNAAMRLVGGEEDERVWRSKVPTLGPFCLLLWDDPFNTRLRTDIELYRGANLTRQQIAQYEAMVKRTKNKYGSFQGFSSCSRNAEKAGAFGNALFVLQVKSTFVADLSTVSEYPDEEEELIIPGVCFRVRSVEFDHKKKKHIITLELYQRFSGATEDVRNYTDNGNRFSLTYNRYTSLHDLNSNSFFRHLADLSGGSRSDYTDTRYLAGHGDFDRDGNLLSKR